MAYRNNNNNTLLFVLLVVIIGFFVFGSQDTENEKTVILDNREPQWFGGAGGYERYIPGKYSGKVWLYDLNQQ